MFRLLLEVEHVDFKLSSVSVSFLDWDFVVLGLKFKVLLQGLLCLKDSSTANLRVSPIATEL